MNRILYVCDNLRVMRGMDSESVDLIATDPPFNSKRSFNAPLGSKAAKQRFDDRWRWDDVADEWHDLLAADHPAVKEVVEAAVVIEGGQVTDRGIETGIENSIAAFLAWMAPRVIEMRRILKPTGSLYLHCDPAANSYLRLLLDAVFGRGNFRNEIVWKRTSSHGDSKGLGSVHDTILHYSASDLYIYNRQYQPHDPSYVASHYRRIDGKGRRYRTDNVTAGGLSGGGYEYEWNGVKKVWRYPEHRMQELHDAGRLHYTRTGNPEYIRYLDESKGSPLQSIWLDVPPVNSQAKERTGWQTQKPLALYQRIIEASSNEGNLVLDPFCGCATTCVAAEQLNRRWVGIDIDPVAETVTKDRLRKETGIFDFGEHPVTVRKNPPRRTDIPTLSDAKLRVVLWNNQGRRCANPYCTSDVLRAEDLDIDHRIPKSRGGADDPVQPHRFVPELQHPQGREGVGNVPRRIEG